MVVLSEEGKKRNLSDEQFYEQIREIEQQFSAGKKCALLDAVTLCAQFQAVIPEWAVDALLGIEPQILSGHLKDFNDAFGWKDSGVPSIKKRAEVARAKREEKSVLEEFINLRKSGAALDVETREIIAKKVGTTKDYVQKILDANPHIKSIPQKPIDNEQHGVVSPQFTRPRRTGRAILRDE